jgi:peptidoglycan/LPS O-acetylase OafA/YrhL
MTARPGMTKRLHLPHLNDIYRPDIDGLRAFAVLSVVLFHAYPTTVRGGYVGVDIFFVISGFLISSILFQEISEGRFSLANFYSRRIRRIFPALAVCLGAVLAYGFLCLMPFELAQLGKHVFFGASFLSNIVLWSESGYFDSAASAKPLLHLWSLGIEEQFYIFWPVLLWLAFRAAANLRLIVIVLVLVSFGISIVLSRTNMTADFYLPFSRFWELLAGAILALKRTDTLAPKIRSLISSAGLGALLLSVAVFKPEMRFPGWLALLPVGGAAAVIFAGPDAFANRIIFSNRAVVSVGLISYPLYLWHWPLISYSHVIRLGKAPTPLLATALVAASFVLAWATYRFIEYPIRFGKFRDHRTKLIAVCVAAIGGCGLLIWIEGGFPGRFPGIDMQKISQARLDANFQPTKGMKVIDHDRTLVTNIGEGDRKVVFGGDSLLFHYGPRVQELADEGRLSSNVYFVAGGSCAPVPGVIQRDDFAHCANLPGLVADLVKREKVQSVVLGASWSGYRSNQMLINRNGHELHLDTAEGEEAFYANLAGFVQMLQADGAKVFLLRGQPVDGGHFNPGAMLTRGLFSIRVAPTAREEVPIASLRASHAAVDARLRTVAERTGAILLDPFADVCGIDIGCSPFFGADEPKFSDGMHLRPLFVRNHIQFFDFLLR